MPPAASRAAISNEGHPLGPTKGLVTHTELEQDGTRWWWWWWCGLCNHTRVSGDTHACVQSIKLDLCQRTSPFGWTVQPEKTLSLFPTKAGSRLSQAQILTQPQVEEKDCEARPPHLPLLRRKGGAIFSISSGLDAPGPDPEYCVKIHLDVSFW